MAGMMYSEVFLLAASTSAFRATSLPSVKPWIYVVSTSSVCAIVAASRSTTADKTRPIHGARRPAALPGWASMVQD